MNILFIMRGYPGSGKSHKAKEISKEFDATICSADDYWMKDGQYKFNANKLEDAHNECYHKFLQSVKNHKNVIIDNTNLLPKSFHRYIEGISRKPEWIVCLVSVTYNDFKTAVSHRKNQEDGKNIPYETMKSMKTNFDLYPDERIKDEYKTIPFVSLEQARKLYK